ncbi:MAG: AraC family transcriptional regulator [Oscillospiraceae bacterium]|nr:AraC family transcriptional regulator [Oscillospiraceae bacterium]
MDAAQLVFFQTREPALELFFCRDSRISYPRHTHAAHAAIGLILSGALLLDRAGAKTLCSAGSSFAIPPNTVHSFSASGPYTLLTVCIGRELLQRRESAAQALRDAIRPPALSGLLPPEGLFRLERALADLYGDLSELPEAAPELAPIQALLEMSPELSLSIRQLSRQAFCSPYHLIRRFQLRTGLSPHSFQLQSRVRKAQRLLGQTRTIAEAAQAAGFFDQSHLDRCFRRQVGITPSEYLRAQAVLSG